MRRAALGYRRKRAGFQMHRQKLRKAAQSRAPFPNYCISWSILRFEGGILSSTRECNCLFSIPYVRLLIWTGGNAFAGTKAVP